MEYIASRGFTLPESADDFASHLWFNLWRVRLWPSPEKRWYEVRDYERHYQNHVSTTQGTKHRRPGTPQTLGNREGWTAPRIGHQHMGQVKGGGGSRLATDQDRVTPQMGSFQKARKPNQKCGVRGDRVGHSAYYSPLRNRSQVLPN